MKMIISTASAEHQPVSHLSYGEGVAEISAAYVSYSDEPLHVRANRDPIAV